jgi:metal-sulfur cluster biosynthetic enzyme
MNNRDNNTNMKDIIIEQLKQVYDPEFPVVDIWTLGMIYNVDIDEENKKIYILMTLTSPMCPL